MNFCLPFPDENALRSQQTEINRTVSIAMQDETPPVPPLCPVVWNIHGDNSSQSCLWIDAVSRLRRSSIAVTYPYPKLFGLLTFGGRPSRPYGTRVRSPLLRTR